MIINNLIGSGGRLYAKEPDLPDGVPGFTTGIKSAPPEPETRRSWRLKMPERSEKASKTRSKSADLRGIVSTGGELSGLTLTACGFAWYSPGLGMIVGGVGFSVVAYLFGIPPKADS